MEYSSPLWSGAISKEQLLTLERIQPSVARRILRGNFSTPKAELFQILEWPTLQWRRAVASTLFLHGTLFNRPQQGILSKEIFPFAKSLSHHGLRQPFQLVLPTATSTRYLNSCLYYASLLWNSLPCSIQSIQNTAQFRIALELHWYHANDSLSHNFI